MLIYLNALNQHVIDVDLYVIIDLTFECLVDEVLIDSPYFFQPKRYHFVIIQIFIDDGCSFFLIFGHYSDLVVS